MKLKRILLIILCLVVVLDRRPVSAATVMWVTFDPGGFFDYTPDWASFITNSGHSGQGLEGTDRVSEYKVAVRINIPANCSVNLISFDYYAVNQTTDHQLNWHVVLEDSNYATLWQDSATETWNADSNWHLHSLLPGGGSFENPGIGITAAHAYFEMYWTWGHQSTDKGIFDNLVVQCAEDISFETPAPTSIIPTAVPLYTDTPRPTLTPVPQRAPLPSIAGSLCIDVSAYWPNVSAADGYGSWDIPVGALSSLRPTWVVSVVGIGNRQLVELLYRNTDANGPPARITGFSYTLTKHFLGEQTPATVRITAAFYNDNEESHARVDQYASLNSSNDNQMNGVVSFSAAQADVMYIDFQEPALTNGSPDGRFTVFINAMCWESLVIPTPTQTRTFAPSATAGNTRTPYPTNTLRPTNTPTNTNTPRPTGTRLPSITPIPSNTIDPVLPTLTPTDTLTPGGPTETPIPPPTDAPTVTPMQSTPDDSIPNTPVPPDESCTDPANPCDIYPPLELPNWDLESPTPIPPYPTLTPLPSMTLRSVVTVEIGTGTPMFGEVAYLATYVGQTIDTLRSISTPALNNIEGTPYDIKQTMYEAGESIGSMFGVMRSVATADLGRVGNILLFMLALIALNLLIRLLFFVVPIILRLVEFVIQLITFVLDVIGKIAGAIIGFFL